MYRLHIPTTCTDYTYNLYLLALRYRSSSSSLLESLRIEAYNSYNSIGVVASSSSSRPKVKFIDVLPIGLGPTANEEEEAKPLYLSL